MDRIGRPASKGQEPSDSGLDSRTHNSDFEFDWLQINQELIKVLENCNAWKTQSLTNDYLQQSDWGHIQPHELKEEMNSPEKGKPPSGPLSNGCTVNRQVCLGRAREARLVGLHHRAEVSQLSLPTVRYPIHTCVSVNTPPFDQKILLPTLCFSKRELFIAALLFFLYRHVWCVGGGVFNMSFSLEFLDKGHNL